ncbi:FkbM family methyltransferase [Roseivirga sp.]|uniref:FkbM family methyltransferase n=1 Tax=Roseivirga sp. TaxID=1964215 RepID=UPI003B8D2DEE
MNLRTQLARIKRKLFKKPFLKDDRNPPYWFNKVMGEKEAFLLQIGSNDGKTGDPFNELLHKNQNWSALFVEPVPYLFERLRSNYQGSARFSFANVAINEGIPLDFYWIDPKVKNEFDDLPFWYDQLGSFDRQHILNELGERMEPFIISQTLEGKTLGELLRQHKVSSLDLLHIDTEGYDWKILSQLDLEKLAPTFILFESNHLSEEEIKNAKVFLSPKYELFDAGIDTLAVNREKAKKDLASMQKRMKRLKP